MKYPLVIFDLDGTILDDTIFIWKTMHDHYQTDPVRRRQAFEDYRSGKIDYRRWTEIDLELLREKKASKSELQTLFRSLRLIPGAEETLLTLRNNGRRIALISGSVDLALETVLPDYRNIFSDVFLNRLIFDENESLLAIDPTPFDMEHKASGLIFLSEKYNISPEQIAFIGDHENDLHIARSAGMSLAFNSKSSDLNQICTIMIEKKDLREVLGYLQ